MAFLRIRFPSGFASTTSHLIVVLFSVRRQCQAESCPCPISGLITRTVSLSPTEMRVTGPATQPELTFAVDPKCGGHVVCLSFG